MPIEDDVKQLLATNPVKPKRDFWLAIVISGVILALLLFAAIAFVGVTVTTKSENATDLSNYGYFLFGTVISLLCNVLSNIVWAKWEKYKKEKDESRNAQTLREIANPKLTESILLDLNSYEGIFYKEYSIDANMYQPEGAQFYVCSITYKYKKMLTDRRMWFKFIRIRNDSDADAEASATNYHIENEYYYRSDERSFGNLSIDSQSYRLNHVIINNRRYSQADIQVDKQGRENHVTYFVDLSKSDLHEPVDIQFKVEYVVELESFTFFILDWPALKVTCEFDYSQLKNKIDFYSHDMTSSQKLSKLHDKDESHHIYQSPEDCWILPKSSFHFVWYQKETTQDLIQTGNVQQ